MIDEAAISAEALKRAAPEGMPEGLQKVRTAIMDANAREAFDLKYTEAVRHTNGLKNFEAMIAGMQKRGDMVEKLKSDYKTDIENVVASDPAVKQTKYDNALTQLDQPRFLSREALQKWVAKNNADKIREPISIELTRQKLEMQYPASRGFEIQEGVKIYEDSGFATKTEWEVAWQAKHPGKSLPENISIIEADGKAWQTVTDADIAVVKKNAAGKDEVVHVEQIKSGKDDTAGKAQKQLDITMEALQKIGAKDASVRIYDERNINITGNYELNNVGKAKAVTRGPDDRPHFNEKLGIDSRQIENLANKILLQEQAKGGN